LSVEVRLPTLLRRHAGNQSTISVEGSTLREVIGNIRAQYPELGVQLEGDDGELHKFVNVYVNDDDVRYLGKLDTPVKQGDSVTILPAVAGGA
jgi:sulfur-carrier protein